MMKTFNFSGGLRIYLTTNSYKLDSIILHNLMNMNILAATIHSISNFELIKQKREYLDFLSRAARLF